MILIQSSNSIGKFGWKIYRDRTIRAKISKAPLFFENTQWTLEKLLYHTNARSISVTFLRGQVK